MIKLIQLHLKLKMICFIELVSISGIKCLFGIQQIN